MFSLQRYPLTALLTCVLFCAAHAALADKVVKVYILAGQSNMQGKGLAAHLDTYQDDPLIKPWYGKIKEAGQWTVRDDVFITYPSKGEEGQYGPLTVGYGTKGADSIGPEFGFGHAIGESSSEPVLIIKTAWGGKSIYKPFRPPSAMPTEAELEQLVAESQIRYDETVAANKVKKEKGEKVRAPKPAPTVDELKQAFGSSYRLMVEHIREELDTFETKFPQLKGYKPEIAGFVWHQGFNDLVRKDYRPTKYADYANWLGILIKDLRNDLNEPGMPVVIGELSTNGIQGRGDFQAAQAAVAKKPEFIGNVIFVPTAEYYDTVAQEYYKKKYWKGTNEQKALWKSVASDRPYHYLGAGKTYFLKGVAFAEAIQEVAGQASGSE